MADPFDPVDGRDNSEPANWAPRQLCYGQEVRAVMPSVSADVANWAAETASSFVIAYCTLGIPYRKTPVAPRRVAVQLALRLAANPPQLKTTGTEGQSISYGAVGLTWLEQKLLSPYRASSA